MGARINSPLVNSYVVRSSNADKRKPAKKAAKPKTAPEDVGVGAAVVEIVAGAADAGDGAGPVVPKPEPKG